MNKLMQAQGGRIDAINDRDMEGDVAVAPPKLQQPPKYNVVLLNDEYTPMEFVVHILQKFFAIDHDRAIKIMMTVHTVGKGVCGTFVREVAESHAQRVNDYAKQHKHPLRCKIEATK